MPENLFWIEGPWPGRLAIVARPRGGEWLADDVSAWRRIGFDVIVSLLTLGENAELDLSQEDDAANQRGLQYFSFPIADRNVPVSVVETRKLVQQLTGLLSEGKNIGLHCRQGIGRSGLLAASLLVHTGVGADKAFERIEKARGCPVPDTAEQRYWVEQFGTIEMLPARQAAKVLTIDALDAQAKIPEFKACAVSILIAREDELSNPAESVVRGRY